MTDDQRAMKELLEEHFRSKGQSLVSYLALARRVDEDLGVTIERIYRAVEAEIGKAR